VSFETGNPIRPATVSFREMRNRAVRRRLAATLAIAGSLIAACTRDGAEPAPVPPATLGTTSSSPSMTPDLGEALGRPLFVDGRIMRVGASAKTVVADWPTRVAPYLPPVETDQGFIGLSQEPRRLDLWRVDGGQRYRLARDVGQSFAISAGGRTIAYSHPVYRECANQLRKVVVVAVGAIPPSSSQLLSPRGASGARWRYQTTQRRSGS
jgi:hypothetical protein